jgi:hypothetical protein
MRSTDRTAYLLLFYFYFRKSSAFKSLASFPVETKGVAWYWRPAFQEEQVTREAEILCEKKKRSNYEVI